MWRDRNQTPRPSARSRSGRAAIAGALVFAVSGAFLIAQSFDERQGSLPGVTEGAAATWVTGNVRYASSCTTPASEQDGIVGHAWTYECGPQTWTASDPRLTGEVAALWNDDIYETDSGPMVVNMSADFCATTVAGGRACRPTSSSGAGSSRAT